MAIERESLYAVLYGVVRTYGTQKKAAHALGVSQQYLTDVLHGRREIGATLLSALGYRKVVLYEQIKQR
jgi:DNA-binding transcriptional regulator YdaS (Cro superfamily)